MRNACAVLLAAALLAGCGRPLLSAELSVPSVRITTAPETIDPGVATTTACAWTTCLVTQASYDVGGEVPFVTEPGVTIDLRLTDFALHLTADPATLSALQFIRLLAYDPATGAPTLIASYEKPAGTAPIPAEILVSGKSTVELAPFLGDGRIDARLQFGYAGGLPGAFSYFTEAEFSVNVIADYGVFL